MVQARPIPGYLANEDDQMMANGSHEEINLEARRRHRQEKLPPLSPSLENQSAPAEEEEQEKILTIEEAEDKAEAEEAVIEQKLSRGQKISNFFKSLGGGRQENNHDQEAASGSPKKKQVRFFGRKKDSGASNEADAKKDEEAANGDEKPEQQSNDAKEVIMDLNNVKFNRELR